jgi:tryptophan synthase alpha chain
MGYPSIEATLEMVPLLAETGCDIVELGIPFSDPLADGATIQHASYQALRQGVTPKHCLELAQALRQRVDIPFVFDLPPEEGEDLERSAQEHEIDLIYLVTPASTEERINLVASRSSGFIYLVSLTGVTGTRDVLPDELESFVNRVRTRTRKPLCVGFGVATPEQVRRIAKVADGVIVGSRIIQLMDDAEAIPKVYSFIRGLTSGLSPPA